MRRENRGLVDYGTGEVEKAPSAEKVERTEVGGAQVCGGRGSWTHGGQAWGRARGLGLGAGRGR